MFSTNGSNSGLSSGGHAFSGTMSLLNNFACCFWFSAISDRFLAAIASWLFKLFRRSLNSLDSFKMVWNVSYSSGSSSCTFGSIASINVCAASSLDTAA